MVSRILFPALFLLLSTISTSVLAESNFKAVYLATKTLIAGRVFENEDQTRLTFSSIRVKSPIEFEMSANLQFVDGESSSHKEIVTNEGTHTLLRQVVNHKYTGQYLVSVEAPFHVLRIRPIDDSTTTFISRECVYQENESTHICYIKMKNGNDVYVTIFREVKNP